MPPRFNPGKCRPSPCQLHDQSGCGHSNTGHSIDIDRVRPAILWQMKPRIAADQSDVASAGAVDVTRFAAGHKRLGSGYVRSVADASEFNFGAFFGMGKTAAALTPKTKRE